MITETRIAFVIWALLGIAIVGLGIYDMCSTKEKAFGFWANAETFPVKDVKGYNKALGKLFITYGIVFILLGIPLLKGENSAGIVISILGTAFLSIITMAVYVTGIERKYRKY